MLGVHLKSRCNPKAIELAIQNVLYRNHRQYSVLTSSYADRTFLVDKAIQCNHIERRGFIGYVLDKKDGYRTRKEVSKKQHIFDGLKQLKTELKLWGSEWKEDFECDPELFYPQREIDPLFEFGNPDDIKKFVTTSDSDHNEGYSKCTFETSPAGYGLFSGRLDSTVPKQGKLTKSGYCNVSSLRVLKSFQRRAYYDWSMYNTLVFRIRGDGRPYGILLHTDGFFDITWHDVFFTVLYTRGGPHWQVTKIPFSKFFLTAKGSTQDKQSMMPSTRISRIGITTASLDYSDGDFSLEIDYIGLEHDPHHKEDSAYEVYNVPGRVVNT